MLDVASLTSSLHSPRYTSFSPLPWQRAPWRDKSFRLLLTGAAGGGKSRLAGEKVHGFMLKYPGSTGIVGRKDRTAAMRSVVPLLRYTVMGNTRWGKFLKSDGLFEYNNGSHLWVAGVKDEGQREALRSIGKDGSADIQWWEEANKLTEEDEGEITARQRGNTAGWRQLIYTTNPDVPTHHIYVKMILGGQASVYYSRPEDNPFNPPDYLDALQNLTGVLRQRLWEGKWVQAEGIIFSAYDTAKHLLQVPPKIQFDSRLICSVDFGFTNPFSWSLWYIDNDSRMYQIVQIYKTKTLVEDHAKEIRRTLQQLEVPIQRIEAWVCDHDAEDRATLEKHLGIRTRPAFKEVTPGLEAVNSRYNRDALFLNANAVENVDEELERAYKPLCTADEVPGYVWSDKKQDTPVKENDHGCDEKRYAVAYVDKLHISTPIRVETKARIQNYISTRTGGS